MTIGNGSSEIVVREPNPAEKRADLIQKNIAIALDWSARRDDHYRERREGDFFATLNEKEMDEYRKSYAISDTHITMGRILREGLANDFDKPTNEISKIDTRLFADLLREYIPFGWIDILNDVEKPFDRAKSALIDVYTFKDQHQPKWWHELFASTLELKHTSLVLDRISGVVGNNEEKGVGELDAIQSLHKKCKLELIEYRNPGEPVIVPDAHELSPSEIITEMEVMSSKFSEEVFEKTADKYIAKYDVDLEEWVDEEMYKNKEVIDEHMENLRLNYPATYIVEVARESLLAAIDQAGLHPDTTPTLTTIHDQDRAEEEEVAIRHVMSAMLRQVKEPIDVMLDNFGAHGMTVLEAGQKMYSKTQEAAES